MLIVLPDALSIEVGIVRNERSSPAKSRSLLRILRSKISNMECKLTTVVLPEPCTPCIARKYGPCFRAK